MLTNYGFIMAEDAQDDSSISGSPIPSVPLAKMQEALLRVVCSLTSEEEKGRGEKRK